MEHEFYTGLSLFAMIIYATKKFGPSLGAYLDKEVDVNIVFKILIFPIETNSQLEFDV